MSGSVSDVSLRVRQHCCSWDLASFQSWFIMNSCNQQRPAQCRILVNWWMLHSILHCWAAGESDTWPVCWQTGPTVTFTVDVAAPDNLLPDNPNPVPGLYSHLNIVRSLSVYPVCRFIQRFDERIIFTHDNTEHNMNDSVFLYLSLCTG